MSIAIRIKDCIDNHDEYFVAENKKASVLLPRPLIFTTKTRFLNASNRSITWV